MANPTPTTPISLGDLRTASRSSGTYSISDDEVKFGGYPRAGAYDLNNCRNKFYPTCYPATAAAYGTSTTGVGCGWYNIPIGPSHADRWVVGAATFGQADRTSVSSWYINGVVPTYKSWASSWVGSSMFAYKIGAGATTCQIDLRNAQLSNSGCTLRVFTVHSTGTTAVADIAAYKSGTTSSPYLDDYVLSSSVGDHCFAVSHSGNDSGTKSFGPSTLLQDYTNESASVGIAYGIATTGYPTNGVQMWSNSTDGSVRHPSMCGMVIRGS